MDPNYYAMEMVEGRMTRNDVKRQSYAYMYSGGIGTFKNSWASTVISNILGNETKRV